VTKPANPIVSPGDRIQLPLSFDAARMQEDIRALNLGVFLEYDVLPLRAPAHMVDPSVVPPPPADDYADGSWTEWRDTEALRASSYLSSVIDTFRAHSDVTMVRLIRLAPGGVVEEHADPTLGLHVPKSVIRLTIPILTNNAVQFFLNGDPVPMRPGDCWYLRLTDPHRVVNNGDTERINMTIDIVPNDWVRSLITDKL
jgi:quercetin dioxygenase-like cupin family protein